MRVEFVAEYRFSPNGWDIKILEPGVHDVPEHIAQGAIKLGVAKPCGSPAESRETKPAELDALEEKPRKRRGRPPGSKNKPKVVDE